jgi:hypothetical protein
MVATAAPAGNLQHSPQNQFYEFTIILSCEQRSFKIVEKNPFIPLLSSCESNLLSLSL